MQRQTLLRWGLAGLIGMIALGWILPWILATYLEHAVIAGLLVLVLISRTRN